MFEDLNFGFDAPGFDLEGSAFGLSGDSGVVGFEGPSFIPDFGGFGGGGDVFGGFGPDFSSITAAFNQAPQAAPFQGLILSTPALPSFQPVPTSAFSNFTVPSAAEGNLGFENLQPLGVLQGAQAAPPFTEPGGEGLVNPAPGPQIPTGPLFETDPAAVPAPPTPDVIAQAAAAQSPTPWDPRTWNWNPLTWDARTLGLILGLGTTAVGLIGLIQKMMQGDAAARVEVTRRYNEGTPEEKAAITAAIQGMQRLAQSPTGGIQPLSPEIAALVEQAYQPALQGIAAQAIEAARRAGFHHDPLTSPVGGALAGPALAQLQGQIAQAKLNLSQAVAQQQMGGFQNMGNLLTGLQQNRGFTQTQQGAAPTLLDAYGDLSKILGNLATGISVFGATKPKTPTPPKQ